MTIAGTTPVHGDLSENGTSSFHMKIYIRDHNKDRVPFPERLHQQDVSTGPGLFLSCEILSITGITITETGTPGKGARFEIAVPKGAYRCDKGP